MDAVLAAAIANPRFAMPYGFDADEARFDIGSLVKASDTYMKQNSSGWSNEDMNAQRTIASGRAKAIGTYSLH